MGTRTRKRGDRRRRCMRGRSIAVVGMAADPSGAHQAGRHRAGREEWSVPGRRHSRARLSANQPP